MHQPSIVLGVLERFILTLGFLVLSLSITKTLPALGLFVVLLGYLILQGVHLRKILRFLKIPVTFAILGLLSIILVLGANEPNTILVISSKYIPMSITADSLMHGQLVLWRVLNSLLSLYIIIATMNTKEKSALVAKLKVPHALIELGILSFRYIQLLNKKKQEIHLAQQLRLGYVSYRKSFHSSVLLLATVFIYSISAFRMNYQALLLRGYSDTLYYSDNNDLPKDRWWFLLMVVLFVVFLLFIYLVFA